MNLRTRLSVTCLEERANPSGTGDPAPSPYDPTLPPAQTSPIDPAPTGDPASAPPYGG